MWESSAGFPASISPVGDSGEALIVLRGTSSRYAALDRLVHSRHPARRRAPFLDATLPHLLVSRISPRS
jgi:hypothetical protein